jgi:hypothetical protein
MEKMEQFVDWDNTPWTGIVFEKEIFKEVGMKRSLTP